MICGCSHHKLPETSPAESAEPTAGMTAPDQESIVTACVEQCLQASMAQARPQEAIQADCQRGCEAQSSGKTITNPAPNQTTANDAP